MRGIQWKGTVRCSFCGDYNHNITTCKRVNEIYETTAGLEFENFNRDQQVAFRETMKRIQRSEKRKAASGRKKRKSKCSFCRKPGHRRPTCPSHATFREKVYNANALWRQRFADVVNIAGVGGGALVQIPARAVHWSYHPTESITCLVSSYSLESLNVFASWPHVNEYITTAKLNLIDIENNNDIGWTFSRVKEVVNSDLVLNRWHREFINVIAPVSWTPPDGWVEQENAEQIEWVL